MSRKTVAHIHLAAIRQNLKTVIDMAPHSRVVAVIKADAYGHGVSALLDALQAADVLAVATVGELEELRAAGYQGRLLLLEGFSGDVEYDAVIASGAETVIHELTQVELLERRGIQPELRTWLKIDSGMNRLGFPPGMAQEVHSRLMTQSQGIPPVLMTHFACADDVDSPMTERQDLRFADAAHDLPGKRSKCNSAALLNFPDLVCDYVRPGIMLYGVSPVSGRTGLEYGLHPAMTLSCRILAINECKKGDSVGYGARYQCPRDMRIGVAGIGYGDGYPQRMPDGTPILVNGREASIAGVVSMDMITIDVTDLPVDVGASVVLWGDGLPADEIAQHCATIAYELFCQVTARVPRQSS